MLDQLQAILLKFDVEDQKVRSFEQCHNGHISRTFFVKTDGKERDRYVLQEVNEYVFPNMDVLMNNVFAVTDFMYKKAQERGEDPSRATLRFHRTKDGKSYCRAADGKPWRMYDFIDSARTYNSCPGPELFAEVGRSFGRFAKDLSGFDATVLGEVIPNFHNTRSRFESFIESVEKDEAGRAKDISKDIEFVTNREDLCSAIVDKIATGEIPLRVTHNDTKLNNVLIDDASKKGICIIDLDTIMPGSVLYDFGDAIRFGASTAAEDETDLTKVEMDMEMFAAFAKGFVEQLKGYITDREIELLPLGALVITFETGMRFLTDYLNGDKYFHIAHEKHNLERARNQFKLVADMETKMPLMKKIIMEYME